MKNWLLQKIVFSSAHYDEELLGMLKALHELNEKLVLYDFAEMLSGVNRFKTFLLAVGKVGSDV